MRGTLWAVGCSTSAPRERPGTQINDCFSSASSTHAREGATRAVSMSSPVPRPLPFPSFLAYLRPFLRLWCF